MAFSDVNSRPFNFELITNNTIIMHASPVSSDVNDLFNYPNLDPMNSTVFQLQSSDHVDSRNLAPQQSSSNSSSSIFQSNISDNEDVNPSSLVSRPICVDQSIQNTGASNIAFLQSSVSGAAGILPSAVTPSINSSTINWAITTNTRVYLCQAS